MMSAVRPDIFLLVNGAYLPLQASQVRVLLIAILKNDSKIQVLAKGA